MRPPPLLPFAPRAKVRCAHNTDLHPTPHPRNPPNHRASITTHSDQAPWNSPEWRGVRWTVYRGVAYDIGSFAPRHPGGEWLINLAIGRDCTALFESYHLRDEVAAAAFKKLPVLEKFPVHLVPAAPRPNDSPLYAAIKRRVRAEVFAGAEARGAHRRGSEFAAACVLSFAAAAYIVYFTWTGFWAGLLLGVAGAWIGVTVQHCGNHGAMSTSPAVNAALGLCNDLIGGASLTWRYHHQVCVCVCSVCVVACCVVCCCLCSCLCSWHVVL